MLKWRSYPCCNFGHGQMKRKRAMRIRSERMLNEFRILNLCYFPTNHSLKKSSRILSSSFQLVVFGYYQLVRPIQPWEVIVSKVYCYSKITVYRGDYQAIFSTTLPISDFLLFLATYRFLFPKWHFCMMLKRRFCLVLVTFAFPILKQQP